MYWRQIDRLGIDQATEPVQFIVGRQMAAGSCLQSHSQEFSDYGYASDTEEEYELSDGSKSAVCAQIDQLQDVGGAPDQQLFAPSCAVCGLDSLD